MIKAEAIRNVLNELGGNTSPKTVISRLRLQGIEVTPQQVSNEKAKITKRRLSQIEDLPVSVLKKVRALVVEIGSVDLVRRALADLEELSKRR
jgi:hypothetical protein